MPNFAHSSNQGLTLRVYRADRSMLMAFDLDPARTEKLAGFAIKVTTPGGKGNYLKNRLNFTQPITTDTTPEQREKIRTSSHKAPFQKFRWTYFAPAPRKGKYKVELIAMYFDDPKNAAKLLEGATTSVEIELVPEPPDYPQFELGFTSGYLSSQYYAERFKNAPIVPKKQTFDFDTTPFEAQYAMLGGHAREMIFRLLNETVNDPTMTMDVFAYDLDEPDIIRKLQKLGTRLRIVLDDSASHLLASAPEVPALAAIKLSAGSDHVVTGHFGSLAHDKIMIQKRNGVPTKVLTGSANFQVRGLYVQANNVAQFNDTVIAQQYQDVFDSVFKSMRTFGGSPLAAKWFDMNSAGTPPFRVSFAPHRDPKVSIDTVADAIQHAKSSVLYAVMKLNGTGRIMDELRRLPERDDVFSYGVVQSGAGDLSVRKPGAKKGVVVPFAYLKSKVPEPFQEEYSGGAGMVIHHKFVVVDFNGEKPIVFAGSSNLAERAETKNGDNLYSFTDPVIVATFAAEAVRLFDHYQFRASQKNASDAKPLELSSDQENPWWKPYYTNTEMKSLDRELFVKAPAATPP